MSSTTLQNMELKQELLFNCEILGNLGWFYRFSRPMAAILEFLSIFRGQILIDCHSLYV